ncbi:MAG: hypothetical protein F8N15_04375 [Methanobacterium sp.]|nr:hypothetical protein [Methanobacterium sp.]
MTVNNCSFINNSAYYGGAIDNSHGTLTVTNCTFTKNKGTSGGALCNMYGSMVVDNCTFTNNNGVSGGAIYNLGDLSVKHSTLLKNTATNGGAIYNLGNLYAQFNRISGNSAVKYGSAIYNDNGNVDANNNWWGSNRGPSLALHEATVDTWLVLSINTNPKAVLNRNNSVVTVDVTHDQNGNYLDPTLDCLPDGIPVDLTAIGGILNSSSANLINGLATVIFTANTEGTGYISVTLDNQNVNTQVLIYPHLAVNSTDPKTDTSTKNSLKSVTINFNMPIFAGSAYSNIKITGSSGNIPITITINGSRLILTPTTNYPDGTYTVNIPVNAVMDLLSNGLDTSFSSNFTVDTVSPSASATPKGGIYNTSKTVELSTDKPGTIYYTTDGQNPTTDSAKYTAPITINTNTTLKFFAMDLAGNLSPVYTENYVIDNTAPIAEAIPNGGIYNSAKIVTIITSKPGTVYYTTDGQTPTTASQEYSGPITINTSTVLKFFVVDLAGNVSPIYTENYVIDTTAPTASATPKGRLYKNKQTIKLSMDKPGTIYYTTDGQNPTTDSAKYTAPITINTSTTLKFFAVDLAGNLSPVYTETYVIGTNTPTVRATPKGGSYNTTITVKLSMDTNGTIYYTIDGTTPTTSSNRYSSPIVVSKSETLKFIGKDTLGNISQVYTENYVIDKTLPTATALPKGGIYNTSKTVALYMSKSGTIYYTLNGTTPTNKSNVYTKPLIISKTTVLKYFMIDLAGNKSQVYNQTYTIDKTAPKPVKTTPPQNSKNVSLTAPITVKFSENIFKGVNFSKIYIKNLSTGKIAKSTVLSINGNTITIRMTLSRLSLNNYQIYIPANAVKDQAGNNNTKYTVNFKTGKY